MTRLEALVLKIRDSQADMETEKFNREYLAEREHFVMGYTKDHRDLEYIERGQQYDDEQAA